MRAAFVTTLDNPYDYFTQFEDWYAFDEQMGYNTCSYVDRLAETWPSMSEYEEKKAINEAVDSICRLNILGIYKKVYDPNDDGDDAEFENEEDDYSSWDETDIDDNKTLAVNLAEERLRDKSASNDE